MNWLLRFVPEDKRQMILLAQRIVSCLDTAEVVKRCWLTGRSA